MHPLKHLLYSLMSFTKCLLSCNLHHTQDIEQYESNIIIFAFTYICITYSTLHSFVQLRYRVVWFSFHLKIFNISCSIFLFMTQSLRFSFSENIFILPLSFEECFHWMQNTGRGVFQVAVFLSTLQICGFVLFWLAKFCQEFVVNLNFQSFIQTPFMSENTNCVSRSFAAFKIFLFSLDFSNFIVICFDVLSLCLQYLGLFILPKPVSLQFHQI